MLQYCWLDLIQWLGLIKKIEDIGLVNLTVFFIEDGQFAFCMFFFLMKITKIFYILFSCLQSNEYLSV